VIEECIGYILESLGDKNTVVRWSAAKGLGRIVERLPKYLGDEVIGSVVQMLGDRGDPDMWHGGCFALAELSRRGLLLPSRLSEVIPLVLKVSSPPPFPSLHPLVYALPFVFNRHFNMTSEQVLTAWEQMSEMPLVMFAGVAFLFLSSCLFYFG